MAVSSTENYGQFLYALVRGELSRDDASAVRLAFKNEAFLHYLISRRKYWSAVFMIMFCLNLLRQIKH